MVAPTTHSQGACVPEGTTDIGNAVTALGAPVWAALGDDCDLDVEEACVEAVEGLLLGLPAEVAARRLAALAGGRGWEAACAGVKGLAARLDEARALRVARLGALQNVSRVNASI